MDSSSAPFYRRLASGMLEEDEPHDGVGCGEHISVTLPVASILVQEFEIGLVDQRCGLECVVHSLPPKKARRHFSEGFVASQKELVSCV